MAIYQDKSAFGIAIKADNSPVTAADLAAHQIIVCGLLALTPDIPILSEEAVVDFNLRKTWKRYWLVDPLDGTREFIKGNGEFTVNIALVEEGKAVLGVIYAPDSDTLYVADKRAVNKDVVALKITNETVTTLAVTPHETPIVLMSRSHANQTLTDFLLQLGDHQQQPVGSSLKFCLMAEGKADYYPRIGATHYWDTAAGQVILESAGGKVCDWQGRDLNYFPKESTLNPEFIASI